MGTLGAGIGGLALAIGLHNKGISFTLYEEAKGYSAVGAGIGFAPNGLRAIDLIEPRFRPRYEKICIGNKGADAQNVFFEGLLLEEGLGQDQPWSGNLKSAWGHPNFDRKSAHRKTLLDIMTSFIPIEKVKFSKRLTKIEQHPDKVVLTFADGESAEASILAGADGIKSTVRSHVLSPLHPEQVAPVYAGAYCYRGVIPMSEAEEILGDLTDVAKFYFGYKRSAVTYRITGGEEFNFLLCKADDDGWKLKDAVTERVSHEAMMADFEGKGVDERFRRLLTKSSPIRWGFFHHLHTSTYYRGRVALLGDSAHASLPFQAAGAAQGLEDAWVLCSVIAELAKSPRSAASLGPEISAALAAYDSVRRPRAQFQLEQAAEVGRMLFFQHEEAGANMDKILPKLQQGRFNWLWFHDINTDAQKAVAQMKEAKLRAQI
ncbi:salicylate hydroxylase [Capronia coronata CBS 617.96]|uniref:Salicylate hydroxylase n=1 Tax=Capronia coronata CBS 617.96 TaxID=1182541 RepID=W9Y1W5_9EURO|nr:salicylate hydroxylase [Capronia coronata CBS 617.96]EXJ83630.1 salicylate hydroxylase [Capronia coronata CBS 617.96]